MVETPVCDAPHEIAGVFVCVAVNIAAVTGVSSK